MGWTGCSDVVFLVKYLLYQEKEDGKKKDQSNCWLFSVAPVDYIVLM